MNKNKLSKVALGTSLLCILSSTSVFASNLDNSETMNINKSKLGIIVPSQPAELPNYDFVLDDSGYINGIEKVVETYPINDTIVIYKDIKGVNIRALSNTSDFKRILFEENSQFEFVGDEAFNNSTDLKIVDFSKSIVNYIGYKAFSDCVNLNEVKIPNTIKDIMNNAFDNTPSLTDIYIDAKEDSIPGAPWGATNATIHWSNN